MSEKLKQQSTSVLEYIPIITRSVEKTMTIYSWFRIIVTVIMIIYGILIKTKDGDFLKTRFKNLPVKSHHLLF